MRCGIDLLNDELTRDLTYGTRQLLGQNRYTITSSVDLDFGTDVYQNGVTLFDSHAQEVVQKMSHCGNFILSHPVHAFANEQLDF